MRTVLFVDDDEGFRELCKRVFQEEGYRVVLAEDGRQAIVLVEKESPDVAVLDVRMPQQTGLDLAEELNSIAPQLPVILYTAYDDMCLCDHRTRFASACVDKNMGFSELARALLRVLLPARPGDTCRFGLPPVREDLLPPALIP
jgi:two-component system, response regulator, stage 0 sporulation protein F